MKATGWRKAALIRAWVFSSRTLQLPSLLAMGTFT